ncbi:MAG: DUF2227 family putative metal-binding protein [Candidatus Bipolaricaulia bacterium]
MSSIVCGMPSGKAHLRIELLLLVVWAALAGYAVWRRWIPWSAAATFAGAYVASMVFLSPDLDLAGSRAFQRWGPLRALWWPYAALFRHRRLSHHGLFGPLTRVGYVLVWVAGVAIAVGWIGHRDLRLRVPDVATFVAVAVGLYLPNLLHIAADALQTAARRRRGRP